MRVRGWWCASLAALPAVWAPASVVSASAAPPSGLASIAVQDVSATASGDAWVVGASRNGRPAIVHWDGHTLTQVAIPAGMGELRGVSAISSTDAWAVGGLARPRSADFSTLVMHWNGVKWSVVPSPNSGTGSNELIGVRALSDRDVWAVDQQGQGVAPGAVIFRWNGSRWSQSRLPAAVAAAVVGGPRAQGDGINAIAPTSPTTAFAAVTYLFALPQGHGSFFSGRMLRLRRGRWSQSASFVGAPMFAASAVSDHDAWAAGYFCKGTTCPPFQPALAHWDGRRWRGVPGSGPGDARLDRIAARSSHDVWATGTCTRQCAVLVERWDGRRWTRIPGPGAPIIGLTAISPVSLTEAWAIGTTRRGPALVHWTGRSWTTP